MTKESISIDEICHKHNIGFIKADVCGVFASVFCDFGTGFQVLDVDGERTYASLWHSRLGCLLFVIQSIMHILD